MTPVPVAIDANVLLAALLGPGGKSARLLQLAALGLFRPVVGLDVLGEVERHARAGIGGRVIGDAELLAFRAAIAAHVEASPGATESPAPPTAEARAELGDSCVLAAASRHGCKDICVGAAQDFDLDSTSQGFRFHTPGQLLARLLCETKAPVTQLQGT